MAATQIEEGQAHRPLLDIQTAQMQGQLDKIQHEGTSTEEQLDTFL